MSTRSSSLSNKTTTGIEREIGSQYDNVVIVADNIGSVNTVSNNVANLQTIVNNLGNITSVASNVSTLVTFEGNLDSILALTAIENILQSLYTDKATLDSIYADKVQIDTVAGDSVAINGLYNDLNVLNSLYADKAVLDSIFADKSKLDSIFTDKAKLDSIYTDKIKLDAIYADLTVIDRIYTSIGNIDTVGNNIDSIDTTALNIANVNITAGNISNINTVAGDTVAINEIYANRLEIYAADENATIATTKAGEASASATQAASSAISAELSKIAAKASEDAAHSSELNAASSEAIALAAQAISETARDQAVASADFVDDLFLGAKASDPTTDNDGNPIQTGAIYFNTALVPPQLKVYDGNSWRQAVFDATGAVLTFNGRDGTVVLDNTDVTNAVGQDLSTVGTPQFASMQLTGGTGSQGLMSWNTEDETLDVIVGDNVTYQVGQELGQTVRNLTGTTIANGTAVRVTGASGDKVTVGLASNTDEALSSATIALATESISNNSTGKVTTEGVVRGLDTSAIAEGTAVWLGVNGAWTTVKPVTPAHLVHLGWVVRSHATEGSVYVKVSNGWELEELHDVLITDIATGEVLQWNGTYWENRTLLEAGIQEYNANTVIDASYVHTDNNYTTTEKNKLAGIEAGATADQTASEILTAIKTVDGSGSGLDADLLDGQDGSYYTTYTDNAIAGLVDTAPTTLDTLNELAAALGDDPNFATTVATNIGNVNSDLQSHKGNISNPHSVTKAQVGLGNADNTADSVKNVLSATKLTTARTIAGVSFDGTQNISIPFSGISSKPTTVAGYGITDVYTKSEIDTNIGTVAEFNAAIEF